MNTYKVYVYAICKNEERFVERWVSSMSEADGIYVLDTGSTDGTVEHLKKLGVNVEIKEINPWRFDSARNLSLSLLPDDADICVCTDLDDVFEVGWRKKAEKVWGENVGKIQYPYVWGTDSDGNEGILYISKMHRRHGYTWRYPIHEALFWSDEMPEPNTVLEQNIRIFHKPDPQKSRGQYLPLLQAALESNPQDDRILHYLGREYMYYGKYGKAIDTLKQHLTVSSWCEERATSMRFIGNCYTLLNDFNSAKKWYLRSLAEAPHLREAYIDFAKLGYTVKDWNLVVWLCNTATEITSPSLSYINDPIAWGSLPYDLLSLGLYYTKRYADSLKAVEKALELSPKNPRLLENKKLIEIKCTSS